MEETSPPGRGEDAGDTGETGADREAPGPEQATPAWRDPQRMTGALVANTIGANIVPAITVIWQHLHIAISWQ